MDCDGCELWRPGERRCYAGNLHTVRAGNKGYAPSFEEVTKFPGRMAKAAAWSALNGLARPNKPWLNGLARLIFVSDMSDALSKAIDFDYLKTEIIDVVSSPLGLRHRWLWLTKRAGRMAEFSKWLGQPWPWNLWVGTSVITGTSESRIRNLLKVGDENTTRFLSVEPQWEQLSLEKCLPELDFVIQGGESGKEAKEFKLEWAFALKQQCREAGVPYFLKQLGRRPTDGGKPYPAIDKHGGDWSEWPAELRVREMPSTEPPMSVAPEQTPLSAEGLSP